MPLSANKIMPCLHEGPGGERDREVSQQRYKRKGRESYCIFTLKALHCGTRRVKLCLSGSSVLCVYALFAVHLPDKMGSKRWLFCTVAERGHIEVLGSRRYILGLRPAATRTRGTR